MNVHRTMGSDPDRAGEPGPSVWEFAGLMLTYWCNARCAFCYVHGGPDRGGAMSAAGAAAVWRGLDELAASYGRPMRIHITGGEPFRDWTRLVSIIRAARDAGLSQLDSVETNAYWAASDGLTRARLELLSALGMRCLVISADVFHQAFVPFERVERCVCAAREVLGSGRYIVRWWDFYKRPVELRHASEAQKREAYAAALARHADRMTGRAAELLADLLPRKPAAAFRGQACRSEVLHGRHVHVDPYGHVFPGTCSGIILGRVGMGGCGPDVQGVWRRFAHGWRDHPVLAAVVEGGPCALLERVRALGYVERPQGYAGKCHLCADVRQFLVDRAAWSDHVGPPACYAMSAAGVSRT